MLTLQVGDVVWSVLPGARALTPTRIADVRQVVRTGYANVHTLQGEWCSLTLLICPGPRPSQHSAGHARPCLAVTRGAHGSFSRSQRFA